MPAQWHPGFGFAPIGRRAVVAGFDGGASTSDAAALLLGATERAIRPTRRFAACFIDRRRPELIERCGETLVGQPVSLETATRYQKTDAAAIERWFPHSISCGAQHPNQGDPGTSLDGLICVRNTPASRKPRTGQKTEAAH